MGDKMTFKCLSNCGHCCGPVPIQREVYENNKQKCKPHKTIGESDVIFAFNETTMRCAFLAEDASCMIYDQRPEVCRKYGDSEEAKINEGLMCPYLRTDGTNRNRSEKRELMKNIDRMEKRVFRFITKNGEKNDL
jgi:Fe-S-cluster containining protein